MLRDAFLKTALYLFFIIVTMAAVLSGCVKAPATGKPGGEAPAVISVWHSLMGDEEKELLAQFRRINQKRPEILIKAEYIPEEILADQVWKYQAGGEGPEVIITSRTNIYSLYEKGAISPVKADIADVFPASQGLFTFNQQTFAIPWLLDVPMIFYRKDKITVPGHISELWEKRQPLGILAMDLAVLSPWWKSEAGTLSLAGVPALDSPQNIGFTQSLQTLRSEGLISVGPQEIDRFILGEINYLYGSTSLSRQLSQVPDIWACVSPQRVFGQQGAAVLQNVMGIANSSIKTTPAVENAVRIVEEELASLETQEAMVKSGSKLPANIIYYEGSPMYSLKSETAETVKTAFLAEGNLTEWKYFDLLNQAFRNIMAGAQAEAVVRDSQTKAVNLGDERIR